MPLLQKIHYKLKSISKLEIKYVTINKCGHTQNQPMSRKFKLLLRHEIAFRLLIHSESGLHKNKEMGMNIVRTDRLQCNRMFKVHNSKEEIQLNIFCNR